MREIKFRAWEESAEFMVDNFETKDCFQSVLTGENEYTYDYTIMQYTGLKDKNGKSIYESDIVSDHVGIGVVKYATYNAAFRVCYVNGEDKGFCKWFADYALKGERESIEVIGDIYENPELIK